MRWRERQGVRSASTSATTRRLTMAMPHGAQGAGCPVDRSFGLATGEWTANLAYVGMTRHRDSVELYAGRDELKGFEEFRGAVVVRAARGLTYEWG